MEVENKVTALNGGIE